MCRAPYNNLDRRLRAWIARPRPRRWETQKYPHHPPKKVAQGCPPGERRFSPSTGQDGWAPPRSSPLAPGCMGVGPLTIHETEGGETKIYPVQNQGVSLESNSHVVGEKGWRCVPACCCVPAAFTTIQTRESGGR
eukprot:scaffold762_cov363-Pavlova_lutheri.AAC.66